MRRTSLLLCASAFLAVCGAAQAGDRYGAPGDSAAAARAPNWNGPLLSWSNKSDAVNAAAPVTAVQSAAPAEPVRPAALSDWARRAPATLANPSPPATPPATVQPASLPASLYDAPKPQAVVAAATGKPAPDPYHPVRPTGEVVALSLANLPPPGPSLERQQAAEDDAQVLAAQIARVNAQAAQSRASGKAVPASTTDLLGGPQ
jgi:hypothetical protein